jgi:hypothetical protein
VERAGAAAWVAQAERLVEYTSRRYGLVWTAIGVEGVDASNIDAERPCPGIYELPNVVIAVP